MSSDSQQYRQLHLGAVELGREERTGRGLEMTPLINMELERHSKKQKKRKVYEQPTYTQLHTHLYTHLHAHRYTPPHTQIHTRAWIHTVIHTSMKKSTQLTLKHTDNTSSCACIFIMYFSNHFHLLLLFCT